MEDWEGATTGVSDVDEGIVVSDDGVNDDDEERVEVDDSDGVPGEGNDGEGGEQVVDCISQPFWNLESQFKKLERHVIVQIELLQVAVATFGRVATLQFTRQPPQFDGSLFNDLSQPLLGSPSQFPNPRSQIAPHLRVVLLQM
jgi:hypothetical protein